jgi:hypothetical protein
MSQQPELTPKHQALMNFLDQLATTPVTTDIKSGKSLTIRVEGNFYQRCQNELA